MRVSRLSIVGMMAVILSFGVALAALSRPNILWASAWFSVALAVLTVALIGACNARRRARGFWSGASIAGWVYLLLNFVPGFDTEMGLTTLPTAGLDLLYGWIGPAPFTPGNLPSPPPLLSPHMPPDASGITMIPYISPSGYWGSWTSIDRFGAYLGTDTSRSFFRIGHSLLALVFATIGGLIGRAMAGHRPGEGMVITPGSGRIP